MLNSTSEFEDYIVKLTLLLVMEGTADSKELLCSYLSHAFRTFLEIITSIYSQLVALYWKIHILMEGTISRLNG